MENTRVNPLTAIGRAIAVMWKDKPTIELDGEQEEVLAKLAPREALELNKSLKRASNMAGKISLEKNKNDFKNSNKVEKDKLAKKNPVQKIEKESIEKEIVE